MYLKLLTILLYFQVFFYELRNDSGTDDWHGEDYDRNEDFELPNFNELKKAVALTKLTYCTVFPDRNKDFFKELCCLQDELRKRSREM